MVLRELRSHFLGDGIEGIVGVGFLHVEENNGNPAQQVTAPVEGFDGVGKVGASALPAMASISAACCVIPSVKAGR